MDHWNPFYSAEPYQCQGPFGHFEKYAFKIPVDLYLSDLIIPFYELGDFSIWINGDYYVPQYKSPPISVPWPHQHRTVERYSLSRAQTLNLPNDEGSHWIIFHPYQSSFDRKYFYFIVKSHGYPPIQPHRSPEDWHQNFRLYRERQETYRQVRSKNTLSYYRRILTHLFPFGPIINKILLCLDPTQQQYLLIPPI